MCVLCGKVCIPGLDSYNMYLVYIAVLQCTVHVVNIISLFVTLQYYENKQKCTTLQAIEKSVEDIYLQLESLSEQSRDS